MVGWRMQENIARGELRSGVRNGGKVAWSYEQETLLKKVLLQEHFYLYPTE